MLNSFFKKPEVKTDQETGEIQPQARQLALDLSHPRSVRSIAGENPPFYNLRDHDELDGRTIAIVGDALISEGMIDGKATEYIKFPVVVLKETTDGLAPDFPCVIMTGSQNVKERVLALDGQASPQTPVIGILRQAGRAWNLD